MTLEVEIDDKKKNGKRARSEVVVINTKKSYKFIQFFQTGITKKFVHHFASGRPRGGPTSRGKN